MTLMEIDENWLKYWFGKFNALYFRNELPLPKFFFSRSRTWAGCLSYKKRKSIWNTKHYDYIIKMSRFFDLSPKDYQNVLLHEMIHLYIACKHLRDTSVHGKLFKQIMHSINEEGGWDVKQRFDFSNTDMKLFQGDVNSGILKTSVLVLAIVMNNGKKIVSVVNPNYQFEIDRKLKNIKEVILYKWGESTSSYFATFPRVRSLRGRVVKEDIFLKVMKEIA